MHIDPVRMLLAERARRAGCHVEEVRKTYVYEDCTVRAFIGKRLRINGKLCAISTLRQQPAGRPPGGYTRFTYGTLSAIDAVLFNVMLPPYAERDFVVPAGPLREALFSDSRTRTCMQVFIPIVKRNRPNARIDLWPYENAWHLLTR